MFIVRQIHHEKEKKKTIINLKKVNLSMEYWLGNTEKLKSFRIKALPSLFSSH